MVWSAACKAINVVVVGLRFELPDKSGGNSWISPSEWITLNLISDILYTMMIQWDSAQVSTSSVTQQKSELLLDMPKVKFTITRKVRSAFGGKQYSYLHNNCNRKPMTHLWQEPTYKSDYFHFHLPPDNTTISHISAYLPFLPTDNH